MMVGLLYMEHGLAKLLGFPLQPNQAPYALFTLNPGLQGLLELVGGDECDIVASFLDELKVFDDLHPPKKFYPVALQVAVLLSIRKYKSTETLNRVLEFWRLYQSDDPTQIQGGSMLYHLIELRKGLEGKGGSMPIVTGNAGKALYMIETWLTDPDHGMKKAPSKSLDKAYA
jgi:hypothetical protein